MTKNVGSVDRTLRIVLGLALLSQVFMGPLGPAWWGWIGVVPLATAAMGWCPPYSLLGINTCSTQKQ